jgi:hypothetical protein
MRASVPHPFPIRSLLRGSRHRASIPSPLKGGKIDATGTDPLGINSLSGSSRARVWKGNQCSPAEMRLRGSRKED